MIIINKNITEAEEECVHGDGVDAEEDGGYEIRADGDHKHGDHVVVEGWHVFVEVGNPPAQNVEPLGAHGRHHQQLAKEQQEIGHLKI